MSRETRACRYCTSVNVVKNTHCRRCNRWLGPHVSADEAPKAIYPLFTRWQRNLAVTAIALVIAVGLPYLFSELDRDSTTELAAPNLVPSRSMPAPSPRPDNPSNDRTDKVSGKAEGERKQNTQIASRNR